MGGHRQKGRLTEEDTGKNVGSQRVGTREKVGSERVVNKQKVGSQGMDTGRNEGSQRVGHRREGRLTEMDTGKNVDSQVWTPLGKSKAYREWT